MALTSKRFGISDVDKLSVIKKSTHILVQEIATEEQLAALPHYEGESSLADYHYLQLMREPLAFDQLVGAAYVNEEDKTCIKYDEDGHALANAFSNNIQRAGKHYITFEMVCQTGQYGYAGIMRPGEANQGIGGLPLYCDFYQNFSRNMGHGDYNSSVQCCLYGTNTGSSYSSNWVSMSPIVKESWEGSENMRSDSELGMLLDLDEGTLSVYKNGRKLGVMKRGLAGPYCWVVSLRRETQVTIRRGAIPPS